LHKRGKEIPVVPRHLLEENKWRAMRWGLDAEVIDFAQQRRLSMRNSFHELLDMVDDVLDDLGTRDDIYYIRKLLDDPRGTGADRQIALYQQTGSLYAVTQYLMQQTLQGIPLDAAEQSLAI
jgi:carboxylate-amine ligase